MRIVSASSVVSELEGSGVLGRGTGAAIAEKFVESSHAGWRGAKYEVVDYLRTDSAMLPGRRACFAKVKSGLYSCSEFD